MDNDSLFRTSSRPSITAATIGGWPSVVLVSTLAFAAIAYSASFLIPPTYRSMARLRVVPARIPEAVVESPVRLPLRDRVQHLSAQVLSQTGLERVILDRQLYRVNSSGGASAPVSAGVIERMRRDIQVQLSPDDQSLEVSYQSPNPRVAQQVAERLASLYIQNSVQDRAIGAESLEEFLEAQIADVRLRLLRHAEAIRLAVDVHAPEVEVERLEHEQLTSTYRGLLMKREQALTAASLERHQIGESFRLVDSARLPQTPISPNRRLIAGEGAVVGFLLGVTMMLAGRNGSFRRLKKELARS